MLLFAAALISAFVVRPLYEQPAAGRVPVQYGVRHTLYYIESESIIGAGDFLRDTVTVYGPVNDTWGVEAHIAPEGARRLKAWTSEHIGQQVGFFVDGQLVSAPVVRAPVSDVIQISGNFTKERAELIASKLRKSAAR